MTTPLRDRAKHAAAERLRQVRSVFLPHPEESAPRMSPNQ
jgi:hypothetical protein